MIPFWRVGHATNKDAYGVFDGPYRGGLVWQLSGEDVDKEWEIHPTPQQDGIPMVTDGEYCGFASLEQLTAWFSGYGYVLSSNGYRIYRYVVRDEDVIHGGTQSVAWLRGAEPLLSQQITFE